MRGAKVAREPFKFSLDDYEVVTVDNFDQALTELRKGRFQLVVSEVSDFLPLERAAVAEQAL